MRFLCTIEMNIFHRMQKIIDFNGIMIAVRSKMTAGYGNTSGPDFCSILGRFDSFHISANLSLLFVKKNMVKLFNCKEKLCCIILQKDNLSFHVIKEPLKPLKNCGLFRTVKRIGGPGNLYQRSFLYEDAE